MSNKQLITTYEFGILSDEEEINIEGSQPISHKSFDNLWKFVLENQGCINFDDAMSVHSKNGKPYIKIGRYVGTIQTKDGLTIEILPKIYGVENNVKRCRNIFLQMLNSFHDIKVKSFQDASLNTHENFPIFEVYIKKYIDEVEKLLISGIRKNYVYCDENQKFLKGKLLIHKQIIKNPVDKSKFVVHYQKYSMDIPQNRIIVSTLHKLINIYKSYDNVSKCYRLLAMLDGIPESTNIIKDLSQSANTNRLFSIYDNLIKWSSQFLLNRGFTIFSGKYVNQALLFSAEKLFESFIAHLFKKYASDYLVYTQHKKYFLVDKCGEAGEGKFRLRPDIVIESKNKNSFINNTVTIIDTKWKNLDTSLPDKNYLIDIKDMYQLYAYGQKYHLGDSYFLDTIPNLILIYPYTEKFNKRLEPFFYEEVKERYGLSLIIYPFNLAKCENYKDQIFEIIKLSSKSDIVKDEVDFIYYNDETEVLNRENYIKSGDRYIILGYYRDKEHLEWIRNNNLYNVRYDGKREGSLEGKDIHIIPSRIVLYNKELRGIYIFVVNQAGTIIADKNMMKQLEYPNEQIGERYKLFSLEREIKASEKDISRFNDKINERIENGNFAPLFVKY